MGTRGRRSPRPRIRSRRPRRSSSRATTAFSPRCSSGRARSRCPRRTRKTFSEMLAGARYAQLQAELKAIKDAAPPEPPLACGRCGRRPVVEQRVFLRGNPDATGEIVPKRFPLVLAGDKQPAITTGQRPARTGRVAGATAESADRARHGEPHLAGALRRRACAHAEQLRNRWASGPRIPNCSTGWRSEFIASGWSVKAMHRLIMLSSAYQMSSEATPRSATKDPDNRLLSRFPHAPPDGRGDARRAAAHRRYARSDDGRHAAKRRRHRQGIQRRPARASIPDEAKRRTVYLPLRRSNLPTLLNLFDFGDATTSTEARTQTNVAPQALFMMNSEFVGGARRELWREAAANREGGSHRDGDRACAGTAALGRLPERGRGRRSRLDYIVERFRWQGTGHASAMAWTSFCRSLDGVERFHLCALMTDRTMRNRPLSRRYLLRRPAAASACWACRRCWREAERAEPTIRSRRRRRTFRPKAKRVIFLFMHGGPSHIDTFDPKPRLTADHGKPLPFKRPADVRRRQRGHLLKSPWEFKQARPERHSRQRAVSARREAAPTICASSARWWAMASITAARCCSCTRARTRSRVRAWARGSIYGLGTENQNLPGFITIKPASRTAARRTGVPAFCPGRTRARRSGTAGMKVEDMTEPIEYLENKGLTPEQQRYELDMIQKMNRRQRARAGSTIRSWRRASRRSSWRSACRPRRRRRSTSRRNPKRPRSCTAWTTPETRDFGWQCLMARRLARARRALHPDQSRIRPNKCGTSTANSSACTRERR